MAFEVTTWRQIPPGKHVSYTLFYRSYLVRTHVKSTQQWSTKLQLRTYLPCNFSEETFVKFKSDHFTRNSFDAHLIPWCPTSFRQESLAHIIVIRLNTLLTYVSLLITYNCTIVHLQHVYESAVYLSLLNTNHKEYDSKIVKINTLRPQLWQFHCFKNKNARNPHSKFSFPNYTYSPIHPFSPPRTARAPIIHPERNTADHFSGKSPLPNGIYWLFTNTLTPSRCFSVLRVRAKFI